MDVVAVGTTGVALGLGLALAAARRQQEAQARSRWRPRVAHGVLDAVGCTPLIELPSLSRATGCRILAKVCACLARGHGATRLMPANATHRRKTLTPADR